MDFDDRIIDIDHYPPDVDADDQRGADGESTQEPGGEGVELADVGIAPSTGSVGDSFDNALAENLWSTLKIELI